MPIDPPTIHSLADGAIPELFQEELNRAVENIGDPNTDAKTVRKVVLTVEIKPDERREIASVSTSVVSKLAPTRRISSVMHFGRIAGGKFVASDRSFRQMTFDDALESGKVAEIGGGNS